MASGAGCALVTKASAVDPIGTAGTYDRFVLVETPMPWPSDIAVHPLFAEVDASATTRVLAVCGDRRSGGRIRVTRWDRQTSNALTGVDHLLEPERAVAGIAALAAGEPCAATASALAPPEVLICAHGKRDRCCGQFGTRLHQEVEHRWPGVRVRRCSHTGGHRFAATGITFPDGRLWADLDGRVLDEIVTRSGRPMDLGRHDRGSTGFASWAQPVDRALLARHGWDWLNADVLDVGSTVDLDGRGAVVTITWRGSGSRTHVTRGRVEVGRDLPLPVCGDSAAVSVKSTRELVLQILEFDRSSSPERLRTAPSNEEIR